MELKVTEIFVCYICLWKFVYKWPLCRGTRFPVCHKAPFFCVRNMGKQNQLFDLEGDSACN